MKNGTLSRSVGYARRTGEIGKLLDGGGHGWPFSPSVACRGAAGGSRESSVRRGRKRARLVVTESSRTNVTGERGCVSAPRIFLGALTQPRSLEGFCLAPSTACPKRTCVRAHCGH